MERSRDAWRRRNSEGKDEKKETKQTVAVDSRLPFSLERDWLLFFGGFFSLGAAVSDHSPTPAARKLTFEMSLLRQGEGWRSISSGELAFVCKYRPRPDGGKLATALQPYGAYARGGVCKDPGPGVRAGDGRLLRPRLAQGTRHQRREIT